MMSEKTGPNQNQLAKKRQIPVAPFYSFDLPEKSLFHHKWHYLAQIRFPNFKRKTAYKKQQHNQLLLHDQEAGKNSEIKPITKIIQLLPFLASKKNGKGQETTGKSYCESK